MLAFRPYVKLTENTLMQGLALESEVSSVPPDTPGGSFLNPSVLIFTGCRVNKYRRDVPDHRWGGVCN